MTLDLHWLMLTLHIALGFGGFVLGALALALPKFGLNSHWHRRIGRLYAGCMLGMAVLSVPLALAQHDYMLLSIGLLTLGWVAGGWVALRMALGRKHRNRHTFANLLRAHIMLMGSSYIAAWTAFLVNVQPLGSGALLFWVYVSGPSVIGSAFISRATARVGAPA